MTRLILSIVILLSLSVATLAIGFDPSFGGAGKFVTTFSDVVPSSGYASQVFIQPSGRIVVLGRHQQEGTGGLKIGLAMAGLTSAGLLDGSFGTGGKVLIWNAGYSRYEIESAMQPDGSIVVLQQMWESVNANSPILTRFTPSGQVDSNFNADIQVTPNQTSPVRMALGSGGKIYVILRSFDSTRFTILRLNENGSRDATFGINGSRVLNLNRFLQRPELASLVEQPDGKLLLVGSYYTPTFDGITFVARYDSNANIDRSFGLQGVTRIDVPGGGISPQVAFIQPDGKILIGGAWVFLGSNTVLARLTSRGRLDTGFGTGGIVMNTYNDTNGITGIALSPDGKITVSGSSGDKAIPSNQRLFVMRYSASGVRESFLLTNFTANDEAGASDAILQSDGKILISGFTRNVASNTSHLAAARFVP